jgi:hypothetical protein
MRHDMGAEAPVMLKRGEIRRCSLVMDNLFRCEARILQRLGSNNQFSYVMRISQEEDAGF